MKKKMRIHIVVVLWILFTIASIITAPGYSHGEIAELKIGIGIDIDTWDPQEQSTLLFFVVNSFIYDTLFYQTPDGILEPRLATKYEVSKDGLTYIVHLKEGIIFSDGTPYNAKAQKLAFDRLLDPKMRVPMRMFVDMVKDVDVLDDYTIQIHLKSPYAPFPSAMSMILCSPISPSAIEKYGREVRTNPVGAGPYVFKEWLKGNRFVLARNEKYHGRKPTVAKLTFLILPEAATRDIMLRTGELDIVYKPAPSDIKGLMADPNIKVEAPLSTRVIYIAMNTQKGITKNKMVRQALNYAVDKKMITSKLLHGLGIPMEGPVSPIMSGYRKIGEYKYNPEKAKELLNKANFPFDKVIKMVTPHGRYLFDKQIAEAVQAYLQAIGVKVELRTYDFPTFLAFVTKPLEETEFELGLFGFGSTVLDADPLLSGAFKSSFNPPSGFGIAHYNNPVFDSLMDASRREVDRAKRFALLGKAQEILWDDCPWIWLHTEKFAVAYRSNLKGMVVNPLEEFYPLYVVK